MTKGGGLRRFKSLASLTPADIGAATAGHTHDSLQSRSSKNFYIASASNTAAYSSILGLVQVNDEIRATPTTKFPKCEHFLLVKFQSAAGGILCSWISSYPETSLPSLQSMNYLLSNQGLSGQWIKGNIIGATAIDNGPTFVKFTMGSGSSCTAVYIKSDGTVANLGNLQNIAHYSSRFLI